MPTRYPKFEEWQPDLRRRYVPDGFERKVETHVEQNAMLVWFGLVCADGAGQMVRTSLEREWERLVGSSPPDITQ